MKKIYKLLAVLLAIVTFSSCETYGDYDLSSKRRMDCQYL